VAPKNFKFSMSYSLRLSGYLEFQEYGPIMWFIIPQGHNQKCYTTTEN